MATPRTHEVDIIRLLALLGICIVNIPLMGIFEDGSFETPTALYNQYAEFVTSLLIDGKFILLFSFIFGWGIAIQEKSITAAGNNFSAYYFRRAAGLIILGLAHMLFVFSGDILVTYGVTSLLFWFIRDFALRTSALRLSLIMTGLNFLLGIVFIMGLIGLYLFTDDENFLDYLVFENKDLGASFYEATRFRIKEGGSVLFLSLCMFTFQGLGAFALGYAAAHAGLFTENSAAFLKLRQALPWLLVMGIIGNVPYALAISDLIDNAWLIPGIGLWFIGAPALAAVYLYYTVIAARRIQVPEIFVLAGRNSLSVYVLQGIIASLLFGGYGLGLFNQFRELALIPIAIGIYLTSVLITGLYAKRFGRGFLEPVLRKISGS
ncbi:MAG: Unknown protein [uncultured Thiotrichaceae bacterium]|uniref:DUF418 domain-containing protein n=1 Tax=uncultured Thiotrichaceae bacterium TaxID=298394 RepID=A0A6S6TFN2_9GAMM|nr:MAG: Unknown protein [uncultured Thiotrichaceae bacterium]